MSVKLKVTDEGVQIPKRMLRDAQVVEIREEGGQVVVIPLSDQDPILSLGRKPVKAGISDAAAHHDRYLYGPHE